MDESDAIKIKQILFFIIDCLHRVYPAPLLVKSLYRVVISLYSNYSPSLLEKDLTYLKQKGYIEYIDTKINRNPEFMDKCIGLTAEGKEIAMRWQIDPVMEI